MTLRSIREGLLATSLILNSATGGVVGTSPVETGFKGEKSLDSVRNSLALNATEKITLNDLLTHGTVEKTQFGGETLDLGRQELEDGMYDFWQIAKVELRLNEKTGKMEYFNTLNPGEPGYVHGLEDGTGSMPYVVDGYDFVKQTDYGESGVSIFSYRTIDSIPVLSNGNYEFWSIAKLKIEIDPVTGKARYVNALKPGERGYVYGFSEDSTPPYQVAGYDYVATEDAGGGVTLFEYLPVKTEK